MSAPVECEGAPRDLGRDQGQACAASLRERFASEPFRLRLRSRLGLASPALAQLRRELLRHFPRQAETLSGIASAAGVPPLWLVERLHRETARPEAGLAVAANAELGRGGAVLGCALAGEWILRRSRPEGGFRSLELTRPWLAHALLGVNEAGLAVAVSAGRRVGEGARAGLRGGDGARLPSALLATDCLQRFATLEACLDWCSARPGEAPATLLFADASGEIAGIELGLGRRRVLRSAEGWLAVGGSSDARERLGKALRDGPELADELVWAAPSFRALRLGPTRLGV